MNKAKLILLLFSFLVSSAFPQPGSEFRLADAVAKATPGSCEQSISALAGYFKANLHSNRDLIRAFYYWTANKIVYDAENMFTFRPEDDEGKIIIRALQERKAVCQGYSGLFHELCENAGIENYVVLGYTKQNGNVVSINHAWVVAKIDSGWYCFDPTWGSGFLTNGKFTRKFTNEYFMAKPALFIKAHMPFDPLWQCLNYPLNSRNFYQGEFPKKDTSKYFSFPDSIAAYGQLSKEGKFTAALRRVVQNGAINNSVLEYQRYLHQNIEVERSNRENEIQNQKVNQFNEAVNNYNTASVLFNEYIDYWNHQFKPARSDAEIRKMLDTCNYHLALSRKILEGIITQEKTLSQNVDGLSKAVRENQKRADDQSAFLKDYFSTAKVFRGALFRRYTWLGGNGSR